MKPISSVLPFFILLVTASCSQKIYAPKPLLKNFAIITQEDGERLFWLYGASGYASQRMAKEFPESKRKRLNHVCYEKGDSTICFFYPRTANSKVSATVTFGRRMSVELARVDTTQRPLKAIETDYKAVYEKTLRMAFEGEHIKGYKNTYPVIIPIIEYGRTNNRKEVFVTTAISRSSADSNMMILGNDYVIYFDSLNNVKRVRSLHKEEISGIPYPAVSDSVVHYHKSGSPWMTATDIFTAQCYARVSGWKHYTIISEYFTSTWDGKIFDIQQTRPIICNFNCQIRKKFGKRKKSIIDDFFKEDRKRRRKAQHKNKS